MKLLSGTVLIASIFLMSCSANKADRWLKQQPTASSLKPKLYSDVNLDELKKQYAANKSTWDKAFNFMETHDLETLAPGKYPIDGEQVFASITEIVDKPFESTGWESHKKYIDLQYIIRGKEKIGEASFKNAKVTQSYNEAHDVANYSIDKGKYYVADSNTFYLFFPSNAHRPSIIVNHEKVKKLVIKLRFIE